MIPKPATGLGSLLRRHLGVLGLLGAWVVIVALGAGARPASSSWIGFPSFSGVAAALGAVLAVVGLILFVTLLVAGKGQGQRREVRRKPMWPMLVLLAIFLAFSNRLPEFRATPEEEEVVLPPAAESGDGGEGRSPPVGGNDLVLLALIAGSALAVMMWTRRRIDGGETTPSEADQEEMEPALEAMLEGAINRLRSDDDPRTAVLLAYAGMEQVLAEVGHPRRQSETPSEYLTRVLAAIAVDARPLIDLARLYEVARFSNHAVSAADRRAALGALERVRRDLAGAVAGGGA